MTVVNDVVDVLKTIALKIYAWLDENKFDVVRFLIGAVRSAAPRISPELFGLVTKAVEFAQLLETDGDSKRIAAKNKVVAEATEAGIPHSVSDINLAIETLIAKRNALLDPSPLPQ